MTAPRPLAPYTSLADGSIAVVDLTQPLSEETPLIRLPQPFLNTPGWKLRELSRYDDRGPAWYCCIGSTAAPAS